MPNPVKIISLRYACTSSDRLISSTNEDSSSTSKDSLVISRPLVDRSCCPGDRERPARLEFHPEELLARPRREAEAERWAARRPVKEQVAAACRLHLRRSVAYPESHLARPRNQRRPSPPDSARRPSA